MARCHLFAPGAGTDKGGGRRAEGRIAIQDAVAPHPSSLIPHPSVAAAPLLAVRDLKVHFPIHRGLFKRVVAHVRAVDGVSLAIESGRTLGLVGESGCGKTTVGKGILRLVEPTAGEVLFDGADLAQLRRAELRPRRKDVQIIFQDPYSSLNPRMRVMETLEEGMAALGIGAGHEERQARIDTLLGEVGLGPEVKFRYPHEFSGGQRQRIAIARAL